MGEWKPRIGIVTTRLPASSENGERRRRRPGDHYCRIAEEVNNLGGQVILFSAKDIRWQAGRVNAWVAKMANQPWGEWVRRRLPIPDVMYENVYVHLAVQGYSEALRREARRRGIPLFNPIMPGKWQMSSLMEKSDCKEYLPPTERLERVDRAVALIREWGVAYIKPSGGYGGNGVMRVETVGPDRFRVSLDRQNGKVSGVREVVSEPQLKDRLNRMRHVPHLVQRGLRLMTIQGRKVDFRVVVHRDGEGAWKLIGIVPKVAAVDGVVTNLIAGGRRLSLEECQRLAAREGKRLPAHELQDCACRVAGLMSRRNPHVALVGFDLGVDESGKVWHIEMNPKPARSLMTSQMRQSLARRQAEFAMYLANRRKT